MFNGLLQGGFLDRRTQLENFEAMLGILRIPTTAINWVGSYYSLVYFAQLALMKDNSRIWRMVEDWFTVDGKRLNRGTLKSKSTYLNRNKNKYGFVAVLDGIVNSAIDGYE